MEDMRWRTSSRSGNGGMDCVELARTPNQIAARDSKAPDGGMLGFGLDAFGAFLADVKAGRYDDPGDNL
jgi:Domain of unknown function (DUF397)